MATDSFLKDHHNFFFYGTFSHFTFLAFLWCDIFFFFQTIFSDKNSSINSKIFLINLVMYVLLKEIKIPLFFLILAEGWNILVFLVIDCQFEIEFVQVGGKKKKTKKFVVSRCGWRQSKNKLVSSTSLDMNWCVSDWFFRYNCDKGLFLSSLSLILLQILIFWQNLNYCD